MYARLKVFLDYIGSRRFAIYLLIVTTSVILIANLIPNPLLMSEMEAKIFIKERPLLYGVSKIFHVMNVTKSPFFLVIPAFITLSITVCTYKRIRRRVRERPGILPFERSDFSYEGEDSGEIISILEGRGWKVETRDAAGALLLYARKGDGGIWGSVVFHAGMIIVIIGGIVSMLTLFNRGLPLTEGFDMAPLSLLKGLSGWEAEGFPYRRLHLSSFDASYDGADFPLDYTAVIDTVDKYGKSGMETIKVNQPLKKNGFQFLLDRYYYAPRFVITEKESGRIVEDAFINLLVVSIDQVDQFNIPEVGVRINARFFPDFHMEGDRLMTKSKNLNNPVFVLELFKGGERLGDGILPLHKRMDFDAGRYTIEFRDLREWIVLIVSKDYGLPVVKGGLLLVVLGLVVRFFLNEKRLWVVVRKETGIVELGGKALYFPALFEEEMRRISEELGLNERR